VVSFWLDREQAVRYPALDETVDADLAIIGAGYTGLWTALEVLERDPGCRVVVLEAERVGYGASGRNGGFLDPSLTHGLQNGIRHFPDEVTVLEELGVDNYRRIRERFATYRIECDFEPVGTMEVATRSHEVDGLREWGELAAAHGQRVDFLDGDAARERLHSPVLLAGVRRPDAGGILDPAKLARGLAIAVWGAGGTIHEESPVTEVRADGARVTVATATGRVRADRAILATNAYSGALARRTRRRFVPVYDYVLVSEPLDDRRREAIGWRGREGVSDSGNRFHYFRLTADDRILWGGYDAVYFPGGRVDPAHDLRAATFETLEANFAAMFPALRGLSFPYRWGGPIATTTRFTPTFGHLHGGRVLYALGYTGLGVATTSFAARILGDMLLDPGSELLDLGYVRRAPFPFPPEPLRTLVVGATSRALARSDERAGRRGPWLNMLDRLGVGFDS